MNVVLHWLLTDCSLILLKKQFWMNKSWFGILFSSLKSLCNIQKSAPSLLTERHFAESHLAAYRHLVQRYSAEDAMVYLHRDRHLANRHLDCKYLACRHLDDRQTFNILQTFGQQTFVQQAFDLHLASRNLVNRYLCHRYLAYRH